LRLVISLAFSVLIAATPVLAATTLDGWGAYKFGMTPDAARAVPGQSFGPYSAKNIWNENKGSMGAKTHPLINGVSYDLNLYFDDASRLNGITLESEKQSSLGECGLAFLTLLGQQEKTYGGFAAAEPERKRLDTDTPPTSVEWKTQGASKYELATVTLPDEYAYAWKARKIAGGAYLDVYATWSAKPGDKSAACVSGLEYGVR
jgi:hypothetical protein